MVELKLMDKDGLAGAQNICIKHHYLHTPVDTRCSVEGYYVGLNNMYYYAGLFLFGRPQATKCGNWYGDVKDVQSGRCEVTRWQVLNLARVYFFPDCQPGGHYYTSGYLPGFVDRFGNFRSTLASTAIRLAAESIRLDYLLRRPPVYLDEPYELKYLMSYCDKSLHKGVIYGAAGFELYRTNEQGIQTWRLPLPSLTDAQRIAVERASMKSRRAQEYRAKRAQMALELGE